MQRTALTLAALALLCLAAVPPAVAAPPPTDPMVFLGRLTAGAAPILRCGDKAAAVTTGAIEAGPILVEPGEGGPKQGYPIDLHNGCGCPSLGFPWFLESHTCVLQPGGATCTGICVWTRYRNGYPISWPTDCGTL